MFPHRWTPDFRTRCFPRARGDVPQWLSLLSGPHAVFPAHAGMFPHTPQPQTGGPGFPRARGDVPPINPPHPHGCGFSPRTRGCSVITPNGTYDSEVFPAHAGMFPQPRRVFSRSLPFSPRTRGCSLSTTKFAPSVTVFPAHAGMFLISYHAASGQAGFPRARGDVPVRLRVNINPKVFSPRTRGCSGWLIAEQQVGTVFPAHAGMFLLWHEWGQTNASFPRARGDVPGSHPPSRTSQAFSPRTRGCSRCRMIVVYNHIVFPAHAGMFLFSTA